MNNLTVVIERNIPCFVGMRRMKSIHDQCIDCNDYLGKFKGEDYEHRCRQKSCLAIRRCTAYKAIFDKLLKRGLIPCEMCSGNFFKYSFKIILTFLIFRPPQHSN